jgi:serine/threonine protein kinase
LRAHGACLLAGTAENETKSCAWLLRGGAGPDFNDPCWGKFSEACKEFIMGLLQRDPAKRMTAADARTHPWIVGL